MKRKLHVTSYESIILYISLPKQHLQVSPILNTFGTFVYSYLQYFIFDDFERYRAKSLKLVKLNSKLDFLKNNTSSPNALEGTIFHKIQTIVF